MALGEPAQFAVTAPAGERNGLNEIGAGIVGNVRVAAECDRDVELPGEVEEFFGRINLPARLAQASGADFNRADRFLHSTQGRPVIERHWLTVKFLRQIGMGKRIEKPGAGGLFPKLKVLLPALVNILPLPIGGSAIHRPVADEVDAAEDKVPRVHAGEFANPVFPAGEEIHFQAEFDREQRELFLRVVHPADIGVEVGQFQVPIGIAVAQWRMVGKADFIKAADDGNAGVIRWFHCAVGQPRVHMIVEQHAFSVANLTKVATVECSIRLRALSPPLAPERSNSINSRNQERSATPAPSIACHVELV